tara:strand:+ start:282 stop:752 length:471 start_codon:yes stop_codon:yes gene_type:complete
MSTNLSKNFTLDEFEFSSTAQRKGIDNSLPKDLLPSATRLATHIMQPVRDKYDIPFSPTSGYRCLDLNRQIGSSDKSQHVKAEAVDFVVPGIPNIYLAQWIADNLNYDQLILEFWDEEKPNKGWVHCSYKNSYENRYQILTVSKTGAVFGLPFQSD